jgi:hypothetical protein
MLKDIFVYINWYFMVILSDAFAEKEPTPPVDSIIFVLSCQKEWND